jgi:hypothetical protein
MYSQVSRPTWHQTRGEYFFYRVDQQLSSTLKTQQQIDQQCQSLAKVIGTDDRKLIEKMVHAGFDETNFEAIQLIPCIMAAWGDGYVLPGEIEAIRQACEAFGIPSVSPAHALCQNWLRKRPDESIFQLWADYYRAMSALQTPFLRRAMIREITELAESVARAAGGFFGVATVSNEERLVLAKIRSVLTA